MEDYKKGYRAAVQNNKKEEYKNAYRATVQHRGDGHLNLQFSVIVPLEQSY